MDDEPMKEYIERKAVYAFCKEQLQKETGKYSKGRNDGLRVAMSAAMNNDAIPAADVRPVVRGQWIEEGSGVVLCSNCGEEHEWIDYRANFCDNCGADMRESL